MAVLPPDPVFTLKANDVGLIHCLCFPSPVGDYSGPNRLLAGTESGILYVWNLENNRIQNKFEVGPSLISIQHTNETLITQEKLGTIKIWQRENECEYKEIAKINSGIGFCRTILAQDKYIAAPQYNSMFEIYDFKTLTKVATYEPKNGEQLGNIMCLKHFNINDNDYVLAGYESGDLILWDTKSSSNYLSRLTLRECLTSVDFDTVYMRGVAGNATNYLQVFNIDRSTWCISLKVELQMTNAGSNVVKIRDDRKVFVSGGFDGYLRIYSWKSLRPLAVLTEHKGSISDVAFSGKPVSNWRSNLMAAAGHDGQISLWNIYN